MLDFASSGYCRLITCIALSVTIIKLKYSLIENQDRKSKLDARRLVLDV